MQIIIEFSFSPKPLVAFGYVFAGKMLKENEALPGQEDFLLTVVVKDKDILAQLKAGNSFSGEFELFKSDIAGAMTAITSFVDNQKRAWKLKELKGI